MSAHAEELIPDERVEVVGIEKGIEKSLGDVDKRTGNHTTLDQKHAYPGLWEERALNYVAESHHEVHQEILYLKAPLYRHCTEF